MSRLRPFLFLILALLPAACALPQPFRHDETSPLLDVRPLAAGVLVRAIEGAPGLDEAVAAEFRRRDIVAATSSANAQSYVLDGGVMVQGALATLRWRLFDADGEMITAQEQVLPAKHLSEQTVLARAVADAVMPLLRETPRRAVAPPAPPTVLVREVKGAPGDGRVSLTREMKRALRRGGLKVVDKDPDYVVSGEVLVTKDLPGQQKVTIVWTVSRPKGGDLGAVDQANVIPAGSLDGPWGPIAAAAAEGGAEGVLAVVRQVKR